MRVSTTFTNSLAMHVLYFWVALLLVDPILSRPKTCSRRPPNYTDCSASDCNRLYSSTPPYHLISQLPSTPPNTRTCYRTCFHDGTCKSFSTTINQQRIRPVVGRFGNMYHIFSPGYVNETSSGFKYRKSTICRYSIECQQDQILTYVFEEFDLEDKAYCDNMQRCIDWVDIILYDSSEMPTRVCGRHEASTRIFVDGYNKIDFEFVSNRRTQKRGFWITAQCVDHNSSHQNALVQSGPSYQYCSRPHFSKPPQILLQRLHYNPIIIQRKWILRFKNNELLIINDKHSVLRRMNGVYCLVVGHTHNLRGVYTRKTHYHSSWFRGYGLLYVYRRRAYYIQTGVDPVFIPTKQEAEIILKIQNALNNYLQLDTFDVKDSLDYEEEKVQKLSFTRPTNSYRKYHHYMPFINTLALQYGNACNPVLRATACNYQAHVLGKDCVTGSTL